MKLAQRNKTRKKERRTKTMPKPETLRKEGLYHRRLMDVGVRQRSAEEEQNNPDEMIIEGRAVVFDSETILFNYDGVDYKEEIEHSALDKTDFRDCYLKYNHSDHIMAMARWKNEETDARGSIKFDLRKDGLYFTARLANTTQSRDLYELVRSGIINKMSFAFTVQEESYDKQAHKWTVRKIDKLYDIAAVTVPAYDDTSLCARRYGEVEAYRMKEVEASKRELEKRKLALKLEIQKSIN